MKKIMFNDKYGLTRAVLVGQKTMTRRNIDDTSITLSLVQGISILNYSRYKVGEEVAVAERYSDIVWPANSSARDEFYSSKGWSNKMFVRVDAMRHRIRITDIKVERLQDITDEDCMAEGIKKKSDFPRKKSLPFFFEGGKHEWDNSFSTPRKAYAALIDRISGKGTWESNPYVFVYSFKLIN